ncbi:hypothetical protein [Amycolatopsis plumensis]|uniref:Uncharacterized protein n=1 Tax=Amycolatopsis plumensis TaxID=236508 RepID=A0ABV5U5X0_9PSEU
MPRRGKVVQDEVVARRMWNVFGAIKAQGALYHAEEVFGAMLPFMPSSRRWRSGSQWVAEEYGRLMWDAATENVRDAESLSRSRFNVGIAADVNDFEFLTKRATLVSDTLLLSDAWAGRPNVLVEQWHRLDASNTATTQRWPGCP